MAGPMNLPVGISAGSDATYLNDGSFLLAGNTTDASNTPVLIHYSADGSLDSSFGTSGYLSGPAGGSELSATQLSNGELLVSSQTSTQDGSSSEYVAEFTGAGVLDTSFGGGSGQLIAPDGTNLSGVPQVMNDGSFLVSANTTDGSNTPVIVGYTSTGFVNNDFGTNGEIVAPAGVSSEWFYPDSTSGDIVVTDSTSQNDGSFADQTTYYTQTGQVDPNIPAITSTYAPFTVDPVPPVTGSGYYGTENLTAPSGYTLDGGWQTLQDGTTLASGISSDGSNTPVLADYNADGSINSSFGNNGTIIGTPGTDYQITYQDSNSGEIVFKQFANQADGSISEVDTYYTTTGQLDPSNPAVATTITPYTGSGYYGTENLTAPSGYTLDGGWQTLQDGTTLASGISSDGSNTPVLADYNADGSINSSFGNNGTIIGTPGTDYQITYQDSNSGEIVFKQFANQADGSISEVDTYYTTTGQLDPSNPAVATTIIPDPIAVDPIPVDPLPIIDPVPLPPITGSGYNGTTLTAPVGFTLDGGFQTLQDGTSLDSGWSTDGNYTPVLVDYNADGSINTLFGNNGELIGPAGAIWLSATQLANGSIQLQGTSNGENAVFLQQFTASGQLDTTFGGGSGSLTAPEGLVFNGTFTTLNNGDILAEAITTDGNNTPVIVDYTSIGMVNTDFGTSGEIVASPSVSSEWFYQENYQYGGNGDIVVFDHTNNADGSVTNLTTYYSENGQVDPNSPAVTVTYDAPVYYTDGSYDAGNVTTYPVDVFPVVVMDGGVNSVGDAKSVSLQSENAAPTPHAAASQPANSASEVPETSASSLIVTPTFIAAAVTTVSTANTHSAVYPVTSLQNDVSSGPVVPVVAQSSYDLGSSTAIASISALKLAASAENRRDTNSSEDENADLSASQDSNPFQIKEDLLDPSSTPKSEDMTIPAGTEADLPDQQEEGKNNVASVTQQDIPELLVRNNLVTTISLDLPDFLQ